ncbi:NAD(P)-dependent oxidoreductase [Rhizobium yanglingense]
MPGERETRGLLNSAGLARLKHGAIVVNTARGELIDDLDALEAALRSGHLAAAGIDTLVRSRPVIIHCWQRGVTERTGLPGGW